MNFTISYETLNGWILVPIYFFWFGLSGILPSKISFLLEFSIKKKNTNHLKAIEGGYQILPFQRYLHRVVNF